MVLSMAAHRHLARLVVRCRRHVEPHCISLSRATFATQTRTVKQPETFSAPHPALSTPRKMIDLRSDTVTQPSRDMLQTALEAPTGDDVFGEDPTVLKLQEYTADLLGKQEGLFCPSGTMTNLVALMAHCHGRASEAILGSLSHIHLWEGGNASTLGGISTRQLTEDPDTAEFDMDQVRDAYRSDEDDHCAKTEVLCLENTHNMVGGVALSVSYMETMGQLCRNELDIALHLDGARLCNAAVAQNISLNDLCAHVDSVSLCLSKGLGAPLGSVLVGDTEFIRLAKRARKRCGGGMRQAGVVASMGLYALQHNVERLADDHRRAQFLAQKLVEGGFRLFREGKVDTNIIYFRLPKEARVSKEEFTQQLCKDHGIKVGGGYSRGGEFFRVVTHIHITDADIERAAEAMVSVALGK